MGFSFCCHVLPVKKLGRRKGVFKIVFLYEKLVMELYQMIQQAFKEADISFANLQLIWALKTSWQLTQKNCYISEVECEDNNHLIFWYLCNDNYFPLLIRTSIWVENNFEWRCVKETRCSSVIRLLVSSRQCPYTQPYMRKHWENKL